MFYSNISIHIEINNQFNKIFLPFAKELYARIINLGLNCQMFWGYKESNSKKIILGAHSNPEYWLNKINPEDIIVNFEPIYKDSWRDMNPNYLELLKRQCVYDYCEINLPYLEESYFFKMPPLYSDLKPKRKKELDVIFIGSINNYRRDILKKLHKTGINIKAKFNILDNELYNEIDGARIYLNLDLDKESIFNEFRLMSCAQTNTLFAGHSGNIEFHPLAEKLVGLSIFKNDSEMIDGIRSLIFDDNSFLKAFDIQNEFATENKMRFDDFIIQQFSSTA